MRSLVLAAMLVSGAPLGAETTYIGSSGVGVGVIGNSPASVFDLGVDRVGDRLQVGLGARVAVLTDGGVREEDWDEASEWATIVRYLVYRRPATSKKAGLALAAGELSGTELGRGMLIGGYESAIDIDHRHLGVHTRYAGSRVEASAVIDDVAQPRILGMAASYRLLDHLAMTAELASDLSAPTMDSSETIFGGSAGFALMTVPSEVGRATIYAAGAGWQGLGAGAHFGASGEYAGRGNWRLALGIEGFVASPRYMAGYIDTFYERNRRQLSDTSTQLDRVRAGGLGGVGSRAHFSIDRARLGSVQVALARRPALGSHAAVRVTAAEHRAVQLGGRAAVSELGPDGRVWLVASEARWRLPSRFYATGQVARLFREEQGSVVPAWWVIASVGAVVGE